MPADRAHLVVPRLITLDEPRGPSPVAVMRTDRSQAGGVRITEVVIGVVEGTRWTRELNRILAELTSQEGNTPALGVEVQPVRLPLGPPSPKRARHRRGRHHRPSWWRK